jgi:hypothetical protein
VAQKPIPFATKNSSRSAQDPHYRKERAAKGRVISRGMTRARAERAKAEEDASIASSVVMPVKPAASPYPKKKAPDGVRRAMSKAKFSEPKKKD